MPEPRESSFYVGYLPLPGAHARALMVMIPGLLIALVVLGAVVASAFRDPGAGVWDTGAQRTWDGLLLAHPYPRLIVRDGGGESVLLLVEMGKRGAQGRAGAFDGVAVRVTGWSLERDGRRIVELAPDADAITPVDAQIPAAPAPAPLGETTLDGEIMDAKCFLGAMKPGDRQTHRACAALCVGAGIPPMLVVERPGRAAQYVLLVSEDGGPVHERLAGLVGRPVRCGGALVREGDLLMLRLAPEAIRTLDGPGL